VDEQPPPAAPSPEPPPAASPPPYRLPSPLSHRGRVPVAPGAPRIPRALRAFNGMPPAADETRSLPPVAPSASRARERDRERDGLSIRDLLEQQEPGEEVEEGRFTGLRAVLGRLRRGAVGRDE
jgi:hypothetical protein